MRSVCLFLSCVLFVSVAYARLGENADQCEKRYGKPTQDKVSTFVPNGKTIVYRTDIFIVWTVYLPRSTNVNSIAFTKERESVEHNISDGISDSQIEALLQANSQGKKWRKTGDNHWERSDGAIAIYRLTDHLLGILDPESSKAANREIQEEQKEEIKGF